MPEIKSGISANTPDNLLLDAGAFYLNYDIETDTGTLLGATRGGGEFRAIPTVRQIEVDGARGPVKGLKRFDSWEITLQATLLEITSTILKNALISANVNTDGPTHDIITLNNDISLSDYINNVTWIGTRSGSNEPVIIQIDNAIGTEGITLAMVDKNEGTLPITFTAHYELTDLDTVPCRIYYPKVQSDTAAPTVTVSPADSDTGVDVSANVVWTFNEEIQRSCVTAANFFVMEAGTGAIVAGALSLSVDRKVVTFNPSSNLSAETDYIAIATTNVRDAAGNALAANSVTNFETAA